VYNDLDACPACDFAAGIYILKLQLQKKKKDSPHDWKFSEAHIELRLHEALQFHTAYFHHKIVQTARKIH
jgi:hypothetical protein